METVTIWMAAFMTVGIFSFLYRDNPFFRFAEHLLVGVSAGYYFSVVYLHQVIKPNLLGKIFPATFASGAAAAASPEYLLLIPAFLGLLMLFRLSRSLAWLSRFTIAFVVGVTSGLTIVLLTQEHLLPQIKKTLVPLFVPGNLLATFSNWVLVIGTVSCLFYFFFSVEHKGPAFGPLSRIGVFHLMIAFGALFGATIMSRVSLLIGRFDFLIHDFPKSVQGNFPAFFLFLMAILFLGFVIGGRNTPGKSGANIDKAPS